MHKHMVRENGNSAVDLFPLCRHLIGALPDNAGGCDIV
nr:MAG TPA: hypothetical protein [Caudoviricetes sp.]